MGWVKIDTSMPRHRKVKRLSDAAFRLHVTALCYSGEFLTDGYIDRDEVYDFTRHDEIQVDVIVTELIDAERWENAEGGYQICNYLEHQEPRAKIEARREADRKRKSGGKSKESTPDSVKIPAGIPKDSDWLPSVEEKRREEKDKYPLTPKPDGMGGRTIPSALLDPIGAPSFIPPDPDEVKIPKNSRAHGTNARAKRARTVEELQAAARAASLEKWTLTFGYLPLDEFEAQARNTFKDTPHDIDVVLAHYLTTKEQHMESIPRTDHESTIGGLVACDVPTSEAVVGAA